MRTRLFAITLLFFCLFGAFFGAPARADGDLTPSSSLALRFQAAKSRVPAPSVVFQAENGRETTLKDLLAGIPPKGGLLLNIWATWCQPCVRELPALDALSAAGGSDLKIATLAEEKESAAVRAFFQRHGLAHLPIYIDPEGDARRLLGVRWFPVTILFDAQGREIGRVSGVPDWTAPEARAFLEREMAEGPIQASRPLP
jgi:thiol-disulfide isomerase/thioredoxin